MRPPPILKASLLAALALFLFAGAARSNPTTLEALGRQAYGVMWEFHPVDATYSGFHEFDGRLAHYTPSRTADYVAKLKGLLLQTERFDTTGLSIDQRIDRRLLRSNLQMEIFRTERLRGWTRNPKIYADECVNGVYYLLLRDFAPLPLRAQKVAERLREIPRVLEDARRNVQNPPRICVQAACEVLESGEDFLQQSCEDLCREAPGLAASLRTDTESAKSAMRDYRTALTQMLPGLRDSFAIGRENFDYILKTEDFLPFDSDSLLRLGEKTLAQVDAQMRMLKEKKQALATSPQGNAEPDLTPPSEFSKRDILAYQADEIDSMRVWVARRGVATVPPWVGPLQMKETPAFMLGIIPGIAMEPPAPLDSIQTSYFYEPPFPDSLDQATKVKWFNRAHYRRGKGGIVHEGYPGHHLQLSIANHYPSFIRRLQANTPTIEGWALYCEQMAPEQGLYGAEPDSLLPLRWLGGVKFRAARIIMDVKLQTGRMSYDDAWRFMAQTLGSDTTFCQGEVRRYCLSPTQPMSYLVGKLQILALRDEYLRLKNGRATIKEFHDRLLAEGSIPLPLIRRKLLDPNSAAPWTSR